MVNIKAMVVNNQSFNQNADSTVTMVKPSIDPIDTILVNRIDNKNVITAAANIDGLYNKRTPTDVATALPPLKPIQNEKV